MRDEGSGIRDWRLERIVSLALIGLIFLAACGQSNPAPLATTAPAIAATDAPAPQPTDTPRPTPTITPTPELKQLTTDGCCVMPSWSPDSKQVLFIDKPNEDAPAGIYAVDIASGASRLPQRVGRVGLYSPDRSLAAFAEGANTLVEKISTGQSWAIPNQGQSLDFAPDDRHIAWAIEAISGPYDQRQSDIYVANIDGTDVTKAARLYGADIVGWLPKGLNLVFLGRPSLATHDRTLTVLDLASNTAADLVTAERIQGVSISNGGTWIAYFISFNDDRTRNGLWLQRTDSSDVKRIDQWGAYQWRDDSHLLVIPMRASSDTAFEVYEVDAETGVMRKLTTASVTPLNILNGDWRVSPDGKYLVFVNRSDRNLWLLKLP